MATRRLTDRTLQTLKRAEPRKRYEVMDAEIRGFGVRVNDRARKTFILIARYPGSPHPARRTLGEYGVITLGDAREEARKWRKLLGEGVDPRVEKQRRRLAEARRQENSFASVADDYFSFIRRQRLRRAAEVERDIRREFVTRWAKRPITDITRDDVMTVIDAAIQRDAPWQAHHAFSYASRLFNWAIERGTYGLERSPCERMRPAKIIGRKTPRTRVLTDDELCALWRASKRMGYPFGPFIQLLALTGQRKSEVAEARWREFDLKQKLWNVPAARMKANAVHVVPLPTEVIKVLESLPRFNKGDHLFSTTFGAKAINGFSKAKKRLDRQMLRTLKAMARLRNENPKNMKLEPFVLHDIRRTMRTGLSALPVPDLVRELVIGHTKPGLHKVYDQYSHLNEKRRALELWAARLSEIIEPPLLNMLRLKVRA